MLEVSCRTGWRRPIGCLKLQVNFRKRATNYRALLRKMTYKDKALCESSPPCIFRTSFYIHITCLFLYTLYISFYLHYTSLFLYIVRFFSCMSFFWSYLMRRGEPNSSQRIPRSRSRTRTRTRIRTRKGTRTQTCTHTHTHTIHSHTQTQTPSHSVMPFLLGCLSLSVPPSQIQHVATLCDAHTHPSIPSLLAPPSFSLPPPLHTYLVDCIW